MNHDEAPLLDALIDYRSKDRYGFSPPGHRQGRGIDARTVAVLGIEAFRNDILASGGLDDRHSSHGYLKQAETLMADAVGAEHAFFSTCGSSLSVKAAMLAVAGTSGGIIMGRDVHKSVVAGLVFSGLQPHWITPRWDTEHNLSHPPSPEQFAEAWEKNPDADGALVVSPTPYGTCADIRAIADICHSYGKPLIVDEAWGAHLPFHADTPTWAMNAGADVCVVSVHKMGLGFEQGSVFHVQGDLVDLARLSACADLLMTTSPNVLIYSAMDGWRRTMVQSGSTLIGDALLLADNARQTIESMPGFHVLEDELLGAESSHDLDRQRLLIDTSGLGISGYQAADWLRENAYLDVGMSDHRRIGADISQSDTTVTVQRLFDALRALAGAAPGLEQRAPVRLPSPEGIELEQADTPRDAFFGETESVPADQAVGRIAAEQITPYPPGIPAVVPGERLSQAVIDYLRSGLEAGMVLPDPADPSLETFKVRR